MQPTWPACLSQPWGEHCPAHTPSANVESRSAVWRDLSSKGDMQHSKGETHSRDHTRASCFENPSWMMCKILDRCIMHLAFLQGLLLSIIAEQNQRKTSGGQLHNLSLFLKVSQHFGSSLFFMKPGRVKCADFHNNYSIQLFITYTNCWLYKACYKFLVLERGLCPQFLWLFKVTSFVCFVLFWPSCPSHMEPVCYKMLIDLTVDKLKTQLHISPVDS